MERIIDKRGTGKTQKLLELAWSTGATVVCSNPLAMQDKSRAYGFYGLNIISYKDYYHPHYFEKDYEEKYVVDELERFISSNIIGYTLTNED